MRVQLNLLTVGAAAGPLYDAYYSTNGTTYTLASDGSNLSLPSTSSSVAVTVPDNSTQIKLVNKSEGCNDNSFIVPVVTTTTTTTSTPLNVQVSIPCITQCQGNGVLTITSITGGGGPPYQTALVGLQLDSPPITWNNYPEVSSYGNLYSSCGSNLASGQLGVRSSNNLYTVWYSPTLCTTTTLAPGKIILYAVGTANTVSDSWTIYINGVASTYKYGNANVYTTVPAGSTARLDFDYNTVCNVQFLQSNNPEVWANYSYGQTFTVLPGGGVTWRLFNASEYTFVDYECVGNVDYIKYVNPCGDYNLVQRNPGSTCDCRCNETCNGTYYGSPVCGDAVGYPSYLIKYETYACNNRITGNYQIVSTCSCQCNVGCGTEYTNQPYCGAPDRYGKNPSSQYQDVFNSCNNAYIRTNTLDDCSCSCNQTCDGEYWGDPYCDGTGIQKRNKKYTCNNANTGEVETISTCSSTCGANLAPIWNNYGDPYCDNCNQIQDQIQVNPCCQTPAYGTFRDPPVDLGPNTACGYWNLEYYCVPSYGTAPYEKWSRLRNTCTNTTCCDELVETNSSYCGYTPPSYTYNIIAYTGGSTVSGNYTDKFGNPATFSFTGGPGTVGTVCAREGTVNVTSGNGTKTQGSSC